MKRIIFICIILVCSLIASTAQKNGVILSPQGTPINNVQVLNVTNNKGTISDSLGCFHIQANINHILEFYHLNYQSLYIPVISLKEDTIVLQTKDFSIEEINVSTTANNNYNQSTLAKINQIPSFLGEQDIVKYLSTLPGVTSLSMLDAGIYVRGGNSSQNAYLVNEVPVSDPQHIGGILSIFDPFVLSNSKFYKSGFPAAYNGALASYIDMMPSSYSKNNLQGEVNLGLLSSSIKARFKPDKNKKSLLTLSLRRSYFQFIADLYNASGEESLPSYLFTDLTMAYTFPINKNWRLSAFGLVTSDKLPVSVGNNFSYDLNWGSISSTIKLEGTLSKNSKLISVIGYNRNESTVGVSSEVDSQTDTETGQLTLKSQLQTSLFNEVELNLGIQYNHKMYQYNQENEALVSQKLYNKILYPFINGTWFIGSNYAVNAGLGTSLYFNDETKVFFSPRIKFSSINSAFSWWIDYANTHQFEERMNVLTVQSPVDVWVPVEHNMPASCDQISLGAKLRVNKNIQLKTSVFYKELKKIKDFDAYNRVDISKSINKMISGNGKANGIELDGTYISNAFYSRINYTYSLIKNKFDEINEGKYYNPQYDVRHNILFNISLALSNKIKANALWTYRSGVTATVPEGVAVAKDISSGSMEFIPVYKSKYNYRLPANHRLDVSLEYLKKLDRGNIKVNTGVYNVYNQQNSTFVYVEPENKDDYFIKFKLKSRVIFPFIPYVSVTYIL